MLEPYNILYPYEFEVLQDDTYIMDVSSRLKSHSDIIDANTTTARTGTLLLPCIIKEVDDDYFIMEDGLGRAITEHIVQINTGSGWEAVDYTGNIPKTEPLFAHVGKIVFIVFNPEPILFNKTLTGSIETEGHLFSNKYYDRLEMLYNFRLGSSYALEEEEVVSYDQNTGVLVTDIKERILEFPLAAEYEAGDIIPAKTFIDKIVSLIMDPPYITISLKRDYAYVRRIFTFDSNKKIELVD
jgi:hypothetical protein